MKFLSRCAVVAFVFAIQYSPAVDAAPWPDKPVHFIVPFPAGGPTDILSRKIGEQLGNVLGQTVIVENVAGAMGSIGLSRLSRAKPDGYTIGLGAHSTQAIAPHQAAKPPYDTLTDFEPICHLSA
ncbi:MAG: Bug family tripartite tricarboxylate transporter substrate binding protein [Pigmentiphaga sp.]